MMIIRDYIESRVFEIAQYILDTNCTVRAAAKKFEVSKSTVHKDLVERLPQLSQSLAEEVRKILDENKAERHIRGGLATKAKYEEERRKDRLRAKQI
jgi:putative DeoR family transcriptional regulator (stage III sporulation protein D)